MKRFNFKKVGIFSNYSWAYTSSKVAKGFFPNDTLALITANIEDVSKKYDFGMDVIESKGFNLKRISSLNFEAAVIDHGFSFNTILLLFLCRRIKNIFLIDLDAKDVLIPITRRAFLKLIIRKAPYFMNKALISLSKKFRMATSMGSPSEISIETTTICNLRCKGCPTGLGQLNRAPAHISKELFGYLVSKNMSNFKYLDIIYPFIFGEPLLNRDIFDYIQQLKKASSPYTRIELHTNGNIKNPKEISYKLLGSGIDIVNISLDGTSSDTYENFRKGADFELVNNFIKNLTSAKKELGVLRPEIVVQMIVTKYSENQVEEFRGLKEKLGADRITYKEYFYEFTKLSDEEGRSLAPSRKEHRLDEEEKKKIIEKKKKLCGWAYRAISIMNNGEVTPCCIDFNTTLLNGLNIKGSTIKEIWNSKRYRKFRKDMLKGKIPLCNKCFFS